MRFLPMDALVKKVHMEVAPLEGELQARVPPAPMPDAGAALLDAELGDYEMNGAASEGFVGFPVHVNNQLFFGLAHPAGLCQGLDGRVRLTQFAGKTLSPGDTVDLMEVVVGAAGEGQSPAAFREHIEGRCRRVARKHDKPYALFECCGTWETDEQGYVISEEYVLDISHEGFIFFDV